MGKDRLLTEAQIDDFRGDGFVVVRGMFDEEEMARIVAWSDEMESRPEAPGARTTGRPSPSSLNP